MTNYQKQLRLSIAETAEKNVHSSTNVEQHLFNGVWKSVRVDGFRTSDDTFFYALPDALKYEIEWLSKTVDDNENNYVETTDRVTHRKGNKVFINRNVKIMTGCMLDADAQFCTNASECDKIKNRSCPLLVVLDKLAAYEDAETIAKHQNT